MGKVSEKAFEEHIKQFHGIGGMYLKKPGLYERDKRMFCAGWRACEEYKSSYNPRNMEKGSVCKRMMKNDI